MPSRILASILLALMVASVMQFSPAVSGQVPKTKPKVVVPPKSTVPPKTTPNANTVQTIKRDLQYMGRYECMLVTYNTDRGQPQFINLSVPDGKNVFNDGIKKRFETANIPLKGLRVSALGRLTIPADGTYLIDSTFESLSIDGAEPKIDSKDGSIELKKGSYEFLVVAKGEENAAAAKIRVTNKATRAVVPFGYDGATLGTMLDNHALATELSGWTATAHKLK